LEVFVHEVIAAITTEPWSISVRVPSASTTGVGRLARPRPALSLDVELAGWAAAA